MNKKFQKHINQLVTIYQELIIQPLVPAKASYFDTIPAIYIFYEAGKAVHVGRTRNLKGRIQGHRTRNHNSASFAFKRARKRGGYEKASYTSKNSRSELAKGALKQIFEEEIGKVKAMQVRFLQVDDPILQYLLELYTALELGTGLEEFDTH